MLAFISQRLVRHGFVALALAVLLVRAQLPAVDDTTPSAASAAQLVLLGGKPSVERNA